MRTKTFLTIGAVAVFSFAALADDGHGNNNNNNNNNGDNNSSFQSSVIGSTPVAAGGPALGGILPAGAVWVVKQGDASVSSDGRVRVEVQGLLLGPKVPNVGGTTGPITMVGASLVCNNALADVATVTPAPLSSAGNAQIEQVVTLPANCYGPAVLVRIFTASNPVGSQLGPYIAASGLMPNAQNDNQTNNDDNRGHGGHGN